ncbi:hypothetical protein HYW17_00615 [Candidatus Uhrbacteria bacterium]|nr:hypothetical protein [Candidatus Uhrbacteria bacterium]
MPVEPRGGREAMRNKVKSAEYAGAPDPSPKGGGMRGGNRGGRTLKIYLVASALCAALTGCGKHDTQPSESDQSEHAYTTAEIDQALDNARKAFEAQYGRSVDVTVWEDREYFPLLLDLVIQNLASDADSAALIRRHTHPKYDGDTEYCGPGAGFWNPDPGDCLNHICAIHDACYEQTNPELSFWCVWSIETDKCDQVFFKEIEQCPSPGECRSGIEQACNFYAIWGMARDLKRMQGTKEVQAQEGCGLEAEAESEAEGESEVEGEGEAESEAEHDVWMAISTTDAPAARYSHTAIWTGSEMVVWGGAGDSSGLNTGGQYDPVTNRWTPTYTAGAPAARAHHTAIWTGSEMLVWGGYNSWTLNTGGQYDPVTGRWTAIPTTGAPAARIYHTAVWTGSEMLVWGGADDRLPFPLNTGGQYDPVTGRWTAIPAPGARSLHTAIWTGSEMIVWGGREIVIFNTGERYDPITNIWTAISTAFGAPAARYLHTAIWTGSEMIVWGGTDDSGRFHTGDRYDPITNTWTAISTAGAPAGRYYHTAIWTGSEMLVWGGEGEGGSILNTGGQYDPATNTWTSTSTADAPEARTYHTAIWTGSEMLVWGGYAGPTFNTGGRYRP